jgi:2-C-methyl-D-erythritol 4-phosphate cytidylyltransferase/2-C-methyl-D-erythritol 2,4-cyclodiphosphate synthase
LAGHSDADVGLHALCDAIYGALADGDIGHHFPPSEAAWRGADSAQFLQHASGRVAERGGNILHLDLTLVCERPKVGPHRDAMRARIAAIAGLALDRVAVKATTSEKLGFTGREEGITAHAVATLSLPVSS